MRAALVLALAALITPTSAHARLAVAPIVEQVRAHHGELDACYVHALDRSPDMPSVRVHLFVDVAGDGHVDAARLDPGTHDAQLDACLLWQVRTWRFPPTGRGSVTEHSPLVLRR